MLGSFLPFIPEVSLDPDLVLIGLLPPLLYAAAVRTSLMDLAHNRAVILSLSVGLVLFSALGVALLLVAMLPISFAVAFALGAIVAPPDAVAATAVARSIGLPRKLVNILEGESLLNDATALVSLRTALAAAGLAAHGAGSASHTDVSVGSVALSFGIAVIAGVGIGVVVAKVLTWVRSRIKDPVVDTSVSFVAPFLAYLPAELVHASGVLSVVTCGLLLGHQSPVVLTPAARLSERFNWLSIQFLLENTVFLLIGLQLSRLVSDVQDSALPLSRALFVGLATLLCVLVLRPIWMAPFVWLTSRRRAATKEATKAVWNNTAIASWAGMRGVVTLAAALTLPVETPLRPTLVLIALIVTIGTLVVQGTTLPWLARRLDVRGPDPREDALQEATVGQAVIGAGLRAIEGNPDTDMVELVRDQLVMRANRNWERLSTPASGSTPSDRFRTLRLESLRAERAELMRIRDEGGVDHEVLEGMLATLDVEESALQWSARKQSELAGTTPLRAPDVVASACEHLAEATDSAMPRTPEGCEECLALGDDWVHLRLCLDCGHVGCCDSSPHKHATAHFHETGHPVMRSMEPGEVWRWCFVDEALG